jgi:hypothetical protein
LRKAKAVEMPKPATHQMMVVRWLVTPRINCSGVTRGNAGVMDAAVFGILDEVD